MFAAIALIGWDIYSFHPWANYSLFHFTCDLHKFHIISDYRWQQKSSITQQFPVVYCAIPPGSTLLITPVLFMTGEITLGFRFFMLFLHLFSDLYRNLCWDLALVLCPHIWLGQRRCRNKAWVSSGHKFTQLFVIFTIPSVISGEICLESRNSKSSMPNSFLVRL